MLDFLGLSESEIPSELRGLLKAPLGSYFQCLQRMKATSQLKDTDVEIGASSSINPIEMMKREFKDIKISQWVQDQRNYYISELFPDGTTVLQCLQNYRDKHQFNHQVGLAKKAAEDHFLHLMFEKAHLPKIKISNSEITQLFIRVMWKEKTQPFIVSQVKKTYDILKSTFEAAFSGLQNLDKIRTRSFQNRTSKLGFSLLQEEKQNQQFLIGSVYEIQSPPQRKVELPSSSQCYGLPGLGIDDDSDSDSDGYEEQDLLSGLASQKKVRSDLVGCECVICLEQYKVRMAQAQSEETVMILNVCNHQFHSRCIKKWFEEMYKCPLCRKLVRKP